MKELLGNPYLTQVYIENEEERALFKRVYTASPEMFREATPKEIEEVKARKEEESREDEQNF